MLEKLKEIEQELMDELSPESYEQVKSILADFTSHETAVYKAGYLDGLQAAILLSHENSSNHSYTIDNDEY
jgi:hypothetical protein